MIEPEAIMEKSMHGIEIFLRIASIVEAASILDYSCLITKPKQQSQKNDQYDLRALGAPFALQGSIEAKT